MATLHRYTRATLLKYKKGLKRPTLAWNEMSFVTVTRDRFIITDFHSLSPFVQLYFVLLIFSTWRYPRGQESGYRVAEKHFGGGWELRVHRGGPEVEHGEKSFPSLSHFLMVFVTVCTRCSMKPFDCGYLGEEVMCLMPYLSMSTLKGWPWY